MITKLLRIAETYIISYKVANVKQSNVVIGTYHASALTPFRSDNDQVPQPVQPLRKRCRLCKNSSYNSSQPTDAGPVRHGRGRPKEVDC